ncbi:MAG: DMT family transporter [Staphylococcus sp.]|nr:DMT family transporter [Staphylococcus sp.]
MLTKTTLDPTGPGNGRTSIADMVKGNLFILISTIFFGVNIPVVKILIPEWMSSVDVTIFRLGGGCVLMWLASIFLKTDRIEHHDYLRIFLGGAAGLFLFMYLFNLSLRYADPIDVSIIMTFPPVFVILIGIIFQHRHTSWLEIIGLAVGFAGAFIVIVAQHGGEKGTDNLLGDCLALASTLCYAFYLVILEGPMHRYSPVSMLRWVFLMSCLPMLFLLPSLPEAEIFHTADWEPWTCIAFVLLCPTFLSYFLINPAEKLIGSELVSLYQYFLPVVSTLAAVIMKVSTLNWIQVVAMVVIIVGMLITNRAKRLQRPAPVNTKEDTPAGHQ